MSAIVLLVGLGVVAAAEPAAGREPSELIGQLGSSRYAEREAASGALLSLGKEAISALRAARDYHDPEVKNRASVLLDAIERALLTRPTLVVLDGRDRPLGRVLMEVGQATGLRLVPGKGADPAWVDRPSSVKLAEPVPFWEALDRLGLDAAPEAEVDLGRFGSPLSAGLRIWPRSGKEPAIFDQGPFRIMIQEPVYTGSGPFAGERAATDAKASARDLLITLQLMAEPRLALRASGPVRVVEAIDDRDETFVAPANSWWEQSDRSAQALNLPLRLRAPAKPGKTLARLRGVLPLVVEARKLEPLSVPLVALERAERKVLTCDDVIVTVYGLSSQGIGQGHAVELSLKPAGFPLSMPPFRGRQRLWEFANSTEVQRFWRNLEIIDGKGNVIPMRFPKQRNAEPDGMRFVLELAASEDIPAPAQLRYYGMTRVSTEVAFDFHDVPLPRLEKATER